LEVEFGTEANNPIWRHNLVFDNGIDYDEIVNQTGINGNISTDPLFVDQSNGDYRLLAGSPAIDAGDNFAPGISLADIDGNGRIADGDSDGTATIDMGAFEFGSGAVADAGPDQSVTDRDMVTLDGSGSSDPDGGALTFDWSLDGVPLATGPNPTIGSLAAGSHDILLSVTDEAGVLTTDVMTVTVQAVNQPPVADAGPDATIQTLATAVLNGTGSSDPDGDALTYVWSRNGGQIATGPTPTVGPFAAGNHTITLTVTDPSGAGASDSMILTVVKPPPSVVDIGVATGNDDAEERSSGSMYLNSSDLEFVDDGSRTGQTVGMRFTGIEVPQGATITAASVQFQVDETNSGPVSLLIRGQDADDTAAFTSATGNISSRPMTSASVAWSPAAWTSVGARGEDQRTPDLSEIIQEIVDRPDWASGNAMTIIVTGSGERTAESYNGSSSGAPALHIEYQQAPECGVPADCPPVLGNNTLTLDEGATVVLGAANLSATDINSDNSALTFTITNVTNGQFELVGTPGAITNFVQADLINPGVQFVHNGSELAPSYMVSVSDGEQVDGPAAATIIFTNVDEEAPTPDPMIWSAAPSATGPSSISMTAATASDPSGVEYYFTNTAGGGNDSGWQDSPVYEDTGLASDTLYTYTVKARDKSPVQNRTAASSAASATTDAPPPPAPLSVTTSTLPAGEVGLSYGATLAANGGQGPYSWSVVAGALPDGLDLPAASNQITGTPALSGTFGFTVEVEDSLGATAQAALEIIIAAPPAEIIVDNLDPNVSATGTWSSSSGASPWAGGSLYNNGGQTFQWQPGVPASGTYEVYAWWTYHSNRSSSVPYRISHDGGIDTVVVDQRDSSLGGQWNLLGTYSFTAGGGGYVEVSSENGQASADAVRLVAAGPPPAPAPLSVTTSTLPSGEVGLSYGATLAANGGQAPYSWSVVAGALPDGLDLPAASNQITGTPALAGTFGFTVEVEDSLGATAQAALEIIVAAAPTEIIVDNLDPNVSATGTWSSSSGASPWAGGSLYNNGGQTFQWQPGVPVTGTYEVYAWWTYHSNRSSSVPYRISHDGGIDTVVVDQRDSSLGGQWNLLGTYSFTAGGGGYVEVSSENGQASADAVRLVVAGPPS
jgi:hypothetical protein